jgi:hypothetical protein
LVRERLVLVVDVCDIATGKVIHVRARGFGEITPVDRTRAMKKSARYLGPDESRWDPRFVPSLKLPSTSTSRRQVTWTPFVDDARSGAT